MASLGRDSGPKVVKGDLERKTETLTAHVTHQHRLVHAPTFSTSDSALKFTHILYNLSPVDLYEQVIKYEKGSFITSCGATRHIIGHRGTNVLETKTMNDELWWGKGQVEKEFRAEVEAIGHVRHKILVNLVDWLKRIVANRRLDELVDRDRDARPSRIALKPALFYCFKNLPLVSTDVTLFQNSLICEESILYDWKELGQKFIKTYPRWLNNNGIIGGNVGGVAEWVKGENG
ncbi:hypothetical protein CTI12_AA484680 [Artemisia annua]|uniref:non-specific serine/threonine protein kinase n=1 Tax=Artemisia annua TaxID=35608 RepID=A0A2U1LJE0_ARTAN|nr:hypothetical protein CTI12_AA484680 [Artemisia annua]